jgi:hypothetical protein
METFAMIGIWKAPAAWRSLSPAQQSSWRKLWASCDAELFACARLPDGDLHWVEIEDGTTAWALCEVTPPGHTRWLAEVREPIGMHDYLIPYRWLCTEWSLDEFADYVLGFIQARDGSR